MTSNDLFRPESPQRICAGFEVFRRTLAVCSSVALSVLLTGNSSATNGDGNLTSAAIKAVPTLLDAGKLREEALEHESKSDASAALLAWERVLDRCSSSQEQRLEAIHHIHDLRSKVAPVNTDTTKARPWRALVVLFDELDFKWVDAHGIAQTAHTSFGKDDAGAIETSIEHWREHVFASTSGIIYPSAEFVHIHDPLRHLSGDAKDGFWFAPTDAEAAFAPLIKRGAYETVFAYVKMKDGGKNVVPARFWGGTYGGDYGPGHAGYTNICWFASAQPDGEVEFHEWLHQIDWMFEHVLAYPDEATPNPDTGRKQGEEGGDPCFRLAKDEKGWMRFYRHIAEEHITRLMWSEASFHTQARSPFLGSTLSHWLVLGPFHATAGKDPLLEDLIGEKSVKPKASARARGAPWMPYVLSGRGLKLAERFGHAPDQVVYAATRVRVPAARDAFLSIGSNDGVRAWVNGALVCTNDFLKVPKPEEYRVPIRLEHGWNSLLFKVQCRGDTSFLQARLVDAEGSAIRDIEEDRP